VLALHLQIVAEEELVHTASLGQGAGGANSRDFVFSPGWFSV
jgi:hypothetical protein